MSYLVAETQNPFTDEIYGIAKRHGKTVDEVNAFLMRKSVRPGHIVRDDLSAFGAVGHLLVGESTERLVVAALNPAHRLIAVEVLTTGSDAYTVVCPRQVFRWALAQGEAGAKAIVMAHNHPSGNPLPSVQDYAVTQRVAEAGEVIGITLLDHLVVARGGAYSSIRNLRSSLFGGA